MVSRNWRLLKHVLYRKPIVSSRMPPKSVGLYQQNRTLIVHSVVGHAYPFCQARLLSRKSCVRSHCQMRCKHWRMLCSAVMQMWP